MKLTSKSGIMKKAPGLLALAVAVPTTLNVAAAKNSGVNAFSSKAFIVLARVIGGQTAYTLLGGGANGSIAQGIPYVQGGGGLTQIQAGIQPFGWANQTTISGAVTLIANWGVKQVIGGKYGYHYVAPFINALGVGLLAGGIIGGLLDPDPSQITNPAPVNYPAITSTSPPVQMGMTQTASGGLQF